MRVGVIADTHGLLRPEALEALEGVDYILHAGDVGQPKDGELSILEQLQAIAPVTAIRGNIDTTGTTAELPATEYITLAGQNIYLIHDVHTLDLDPVAADVAAVISGHSHKPHTERRNGVLYFNPGAAGPRRFSLPISLGFLEVTETGVESCVRILQVL